MNEDNESPSKNIKMSVSGTPGHTPHQEFGIALCNARYMQIIVRENGP